MIRNSYVLIALAGVLLLFLFLCGCIASGVGVYSIYSLFNITGIADPFQALQTPTNTPVVIRPTQIPVTLSQTEATDHPEKPGNAVQDAAPETTLYENLTLLDETIVPENDPLELAFRFEGKTGLSRTSPPPETWFKTGDQQSFWVLNADDNQNYEVQATLQYVTDHLYFWIEDGVDFNLDQIKQLSDTFEEEIYPTNREFFGSEWTPGVDGDPHLYILLAEDLGGTVAGYFSPGDEYLPEVKEFSNGHEMFLLSADRLNLASDFSYGVLAHEFQHMIHWYTDTNEESWVNEGFSELAALLNGYGNGQVEQAYGAVPSLQLNRWSSDPQINRAHYGASFLFFTYFLDRFGESVTKALVAHTANGMESIDLVLEELGIVDPLTNQIIRANDIFSDWAITNYLHDGTVRDGRFAYHNFPDAPAMRAAQTVSDCPSGIITRSVSQYGVDYIKINCEGELIINFDGSVEVDIMPVDPHSGRYTFFSNRSDESNTKLTKEFDFSEVSGPLTLSYWTWYDIEEDYDYVYLTASRNGESWEILTTPSGTDEDPSGNSYGWGYNGKSGDGPKWIQETVDISQFAGETVQLRFEYLTDAAVNTEGFLLDDVSIPEIEYFSDFEEDGGGWQADGFVRIQNKLPQFFRVSLIKMSESNQVEYIDLTQENSTAIPIAIGDEFDEVVLVISGTTPHTRQNATYQFEIQPKTAQ